MMDYAEAEWNRQINDCIRQLQDAQHVAERIVSELMRLQTACDRKRNVVDKFKGIDRFDVEVYARLLRDSMGHEVGQVVRTLNAAYDGALSVDHVLDQIE
ncbi:hypothetical protein [Mycolicibacterium neoaurum]|uniref:hypothetical protein n=1 Tax=Mycolicibacterium neoaurum TaxID=1795 RepID=UPI001F4CC655|nr:hypothetical protein [Mycolicibacterium neoaurum]